jgi:hypothetical protein
MKPRNAALLLATLLLLATAPGARAQGATAVQPGPWKFTSTAGLTLTQSSFSNNWHGGDKGSIVWVLNGDAKAERQFSTRYNLSNVLQVAYGQTSRQAADPADPSRLIWAAPDKTTDLIAFESTSRWTLHRFVDPYLALRAESQFSDRSNPLGAISFNPIKLKESAGVARVLVKTEDREAISRLGFGFRQTLAKSIVDPVTLAKESFTSNDGGIEWNTTATWPMLEKRVVYKGSLLVFKPVFYSKADALDLFDAAAIAFDPTREPVADFWKSTDVDFLNTFTAGITKHLSVSLLAQLRYDKFDSAANVDNALALGVLVPEIDKNVRKAGQFKETLAIGLTVQLF